MFFENLRGQNRFCTKIGITQVITGSLNKIFPKIFFLTGIINIMPNHGYVGWRKFFLRFQGREISSSSFVKNRNFQPENLQIAATRT